MSKETDELTKDNAKDIQEIKVELAIYKQKQHDDEDHRKWFRTICISATSVFLSGLYWLGGQIYDKFDAVKAAIITFINATKHGQ